MVNQLSVWRPDDPISRLTQSQAKIDVVKSDRQVYFIEAAQSQVHISPYHSASSGYCRQILREMRTSEVPWIVADSCVRVAGHSARAQNHSGMLDRAVRVPEPCTNHSYFRS